MRSTVLIPLALSLMLAACGGGGGGGSPPAPPPPGDTTPPDTTIVSGPPAATTVNSATFTFSASETGATFEVSLDGAAYAAGTSPTTLTGLATGTHTFSVRARDAAGNVDPSPATFTWAIDLVPPSARIIFPTPLSYTTASTLNVRGNANDASGVKAVSVNGVTATTHDGFQNWQATVPIATGSNILSVTVTDAAGNVTTDAATAQVTNNGPANYQMAGMDYDATGDRMVVADAALNAIYYYKMSDGVAHTLSPTPNAVDTQYGIADLAVDAPGNRAILVEYFLNALLAVDLGTGARTVVSTSLEAVAGTTFSSTSAIALDTTNEVAFVADRGSNSIIRVDLATGVRSVLSSSAVGSGDALNSPAAIVFDYVSVPGVPRLLVCQGGYVNGILIPAEIMAVDLATGDRTAVTLVPQPDTLPLDTPVAMRIDVASKRLFVLDRRYASIVAIDLTIGAQSNFTGGLTLVGLLVDGGPLLSTSQRLALDPVAPGNLIADTAGGGLITIDLTTRERSIFGGSQVGSGSPLSYPTSIAIEQASGTPASLLLGDMNSPRLNRLNLASGMRVAVSDDSSGIGSGPSLEGFADVVLDTRASANGHTALVLVGFPLNQLLSVDLATGDRSFVADLNSSAPAVNSVGHMRLDAAGNRILFTDAVDGGTNSIYSIDLGSGVRTTISSPSLGAGPNFMQASYITLDPAVSPTRALVSDIGLGGIFAVDLATGNRSYLTQRFAGVATIGDNVPSGIFLDSGNSRLLALRIGAVSNLYSVDLASGNQQILSGTDPASTTIAGGGPLPYGCLGLDVSTTDRVAYVACAYTTSIMAIDLVSGDRVLIAR